MTKPVLSLTMVEVGKVELGRIECKRSVTLLVCLIQLKFSRHQCTIYTSNMLAICKLLVTRSTTRVYNN